MGRDANRSGRLRGAGQRDGWADRRIHPDRRDVAKKDDLVRRARLADASAGRDVGRSDDRLKAAGHDCRWALVRDFRLAADRGCQKGSDAAADRRDDVVQQRDERADLELAGRERRDAEQAGAGRA